MVEAMVLQFLFKCFIKYLLKQNKFDDDMMALIFNTHKIDFGMNIVQLIVEEFPIH